MARKQQVSIQDTVETDEEFDAYLEANSYRLISDDKKKINNFQGLEVYSEFCGPCVATAQAVRKAKLEIGQDDIAMVKAPADHITILSRFKNKSEPKFMFLQKGKLTRIMFGANGIELCRLVEEELAAFKNEKERGIEVPKFEIGELLPMEAEKQEEDERIDREYMEAAHRLRVLTLAARKKRVSERLSRHIKRLNFIMFWPQHHQAHYDLYEKWDMINIQVSAKDTFQLTEESAKEAMYMSDVDLNDACMHALLSGEVMVVLFKMFETDDRDFVKLMRHTLYEEVPEPKEDVPPEKQVPPVPAYERYASISKTAREVRRDRYEAKLQKLREEQEERDRLAAEQARMAREAEEERLRMEKQKAEEEKMARIAAGLPAEPEPTEVVAEEGVEGEEGEGGEGVEEGEGGEGDGGENAETEVTDLTTEPPLEGEALIGEGEELLGEGEENKPEEEFHSDVEVEGEDYIPPGGLFVPGLYCPPNELAKANGLKLFFHKIVSGYAPVESEVLPPHMLLMFTIDKRHDVMEIVNQYRDEILNVDAAADLLVKSHFYNTHGKRWDGAILESYKQPQYRFPANILDKNGVEGLGIFVGDDPFNAEHIAYTVKQYDKMVRAYKYKDRVAVMVSRKRSLPLLQLAGFNPIYISSDVAAGERDCLTLFPVGYGDDYLEEESLKEEEIKEVEQVKEEVVEEPPAPEEAEEEEDEEEA